MRCIVLFSLIVVSSIAWTGKKGFDFEGLIDKLKANREQFIDRLSARGKEQLEKSMKGLNLTRRHERLEKLGKKFSQKRAKNIELNEKMRKKIDEAKEKIRVAKTETLLDEGDDLFDVNNIQGVSDYLFQGDINLTDEQLQAIEDEVETESEDDASDNEKRKKRQASSVYRKWTNNIVNYYIDPSINQRKRDSIDAALKYLMERTCIKFVYNATAPNRIKVFNGVGCYATIGMTGSEQTLSLGDGCEVIGTVAHEFNHALGFWHYQMRNDRDDYVIIDLSDVDPSQQHNFIKYDASQIINYTPYEYGSFMHYGANSFTKTAGKMSVIAKNADYAYTMGNRQISFNDIRMINAHYGCDAVCRGTVSYKCLNGGVINPAKCGYCTCPDGYSGNDCSERPAGCGSTLAATASWQTTELIVGNTTSQNVRDVFSKCTSWITAPADKKIQVKITSIYNGQCNYGCQYNGIEIKRLTDQQMTNPRICCPEFMNIVYTSELNPTPIITFNRYYYSQFQIQYKYI